MIFCAIIVIMVESFIGRIFVFIKPVFFYILKFLLIDLKSGLLEDFAPKYKAK